MPDASTMDPAAVLHRLDNLQKWVESGERLTNIDGRWLCRTLRTALADTQKVAELKQTNGDIAAEFGRQIDALETQLQVALADTRRVEEAKDNAYAERNKVVIALAHLAQQQGCRVGLDRTAIEGWEPEWHNCLYIDLPTGQVSWHFHDRELPQLADIGAYPGQWDGHTTEEKYERLAAMAATPRED